AAGWSILFQPHVWSWALACCSFRCSRPRNGTSVIECSTTAAAHGLIGNIAAGNATAIGQSAGALVIVNRARQLGGVLRSLTMGSVSLAWVKTRL
ncbi:hypothetical protein N7534_005631, partial [Penicillium rubens]